MRPRLVLVPILASLFACSDKLSTAPNAGRPSFDIADAARNYKSGFYWLPPMVRQPNASGTFDASLSPTVEICVLAGDVCGDVIATYTTTSGPGGELVRIQDTHYHVNWHTDEFGLNDASVYRISVRAGNNVLLGYADVQPAANGSGLKNIDSDEFMGLVDGRTLPIKFRIETGVVGSIEVQPPEATLEPGGTQQYVAIVSDLHGNPMSADVVWSSSDESVATIDQSGLATAVAAGTAIITATAEFVSGSATLTVEAPEEPVVTSIALEPVEVTLEPGGTQQYVATIKDQHGNPMSADLTWSSSDESVAIVDQSGLATAVAEGTAIITATAGSVSGSATLTVDAPVEEGVVLASAGDSHSCAVNEAGIAFCWGMGSSGQLGNGFLVNRFTPFPVAGGLTFTAIATAETHSCGITSTGQAYCWGANNVGQLGNGTPGMQTSPSLVAGDLSFTSIVAGVFHTCALTASGQAYCWGFSTSGALGTGTTSASTPTPVLGNHTFASLTAGRTHTCGLTAAGEAFCWGLNSSGQLGDGTTGNKLIPTGVIGGLTFASISAGDAHTCALTATGSAYCWGNAGQGRLGIGDAGESFYSSPQSVAGGLTFTAITAGEAHSCGITTTGEAYCWGSNAGGRLGVDSTDPQSLVPAAVVTRGLLFRSIDVGDHSCAVTTTNAVYCWGPGGTGQLGNGTTSNQPAPTPISPFPES